MARGLVAVLGLLAVMWAPGVSAAQSQPAANPEVAPTIDLGMPFSGRWAYNVATTAGCGAASGQTSHPSCHEIYSGADWSTDLYAPDGTDVRLRLTANFTPTFEFISTSDGSCGNRVSFRIRNGSAVVGRIYFDHLKNEVNSTAEISNGGVLGKIDQTCHVGFAHTHIEVQGLAGRACYTNHSTPGQSAGVPLGDGVKIGQLVSTVTGTREICPSDPPPPSDGDGDGVADASDSCPTLPGPSEASGCPRVAILYSDARSVLVKEGPLNATWTTVSGGASQVKIAGSRIGVLTPDGVLFVKEGPVGATWTRVASSVVSFDLTATRVAIVRGAGRSVLVKEGPLNAQWTTLSSGAKRVVVAGTRVGVLSTAGVLSVKEGPLDATWTRVASSVVSFDLTATRVAIVRGAGRSVLVKEGPLNAQWTTVAASQGFGVGVT